MSKELLYLHGLESGPSGRKARWLSGHYDTVVPQLDTAAAAAAIEAVRAAGWVDGHPAVRAGLEPALAQARAALAEHEPEIVVGSSFGGALAAALLAEGTWRGPTLLLAPAARRLLGDVRLPADARAVIVHGRHDDVVPVEDGRALAATGGARTLYVEVDDGHRLEGILEHGVLEAAVGWLFRST
jgi:hypothetical protein